MRTCGVEITGSDVLLCILSKDNDVFDIRDVRQTRFTLGNGNDTEVMRKFQFDFAKLMQDYQIDSVAIRERQPKGKFAGSAKGFKMETAILTLHTATKSGRLKTQRWFRIETALRSHR